MGRPRAILLVLACWLAAVAAAQLGAARKHFERGRELFEEHDDTGEALRQAEVEFRRALKLNPRLAAARAYLGFIAADQERPGEAEAAYRKALAIDPRCAEARVGLARLRASANRRGEALDELRRAVRENPMHPLALSDLAVYLIHENSRPTTEMWREAMRCWRTLVRLDKNDRDAHHRLAEASERFENWHDAEHHYRGVLRIGQIPEDMDVWVYSIHLNLAHVLEQQGRFREATREYQALIDSGTAGEEEIARARARIQVLEKRASPPRWTPDPAARGRP